MKRIVSIIIIVCMLVFPMTANADRAATDGKLDRESSERLTDSYDIVPLKEDRKLDYITNFDISQNNQIAVCYTYSMFNITRTMTNTLCVYDLQGNFLYGYEFFCSGDAKVFWVDDRPAIHDYRASLLSVIDQDGKISAVYDFIEPADYTPLVEEKEFNGKTYLAKGDGQFVDLYTSIVEVVGDDEVTIIEVNYINWTPIFFIVFLALLVLNIFRIRKRQSKKEVNELHKNIS